MLLDSRLTEVLVGRAVANASVSEVRSLVGGDAVAELILDAFTNGLIDVRAYRSEMDRHDLLTLVAAAI